MTFADRVKQVRARARVRRWEYRQRNLAHGAWHRFRLALVAARTAYTIDESQFSALLEEGYAQDGRGADLVPPRRIVWITSERAARLLHATELAMRFDAAMLASPILALVPFREP